MNVDYQLEKALQNKDKAGIINKYQSRLKGFIAKRVPSKEDAEDILQDVFFQLAKIDMDESPIEHISSWLYSVASNRIVDKYRKQKEEEMPYYTSTDEEGIFIEEITNLLLDEESSPENDLIKSMIWDALEKALTELPMEQRTVFELTELQGFSFKEISESTGITVNTLLSRKRYAVLFLREKLLELYNDLLIE